MFKLRSQTDYETRSAAGVRELFTLGQYRFHDTLDDDGAMHHFVTDTAGTEGEAEAYEMDAPTAYEFMARYLAGLHEMEEYAMEQSPAQDELLDVLEIATARARAGETDFTWDEFDTAESEVLDDGDEVEEVADEDANGDGERSG
jgi:aminoglycoside phosphotransferase